MNKRTLIKDINGLTIDAQVLAEYGSILIRNDHSNVSNLEDLKQNTREVIADIEKVIAGIKSLLQNTNATSASAARESVNA